MTLNRARLTLDADADGDGTVETGVFEMLGDLVLTEGVRTGFVVGGRGSTVNSIISEVASDGEDQRQGFYADFGGGAHLFELEFSGWEGAQDSTGSNLQWGDDATATLTASSATGQDPISQVNVLNRYLVAGTFDSRDPATLEIGEYSTGGAFDTANLSASSLDVVIESPRLSVRAEEGGALVNGSLTCIAAADIRDLWDATERNPY